MWWDHLFITCTNIVILLQFYWIKLKGLMFLLLKKLMRCIRLFYDPYFRWQLQGIRKHYTIYSDEFMTQKFLIWLECKVFVFLWLFSFEIKSWKALIWRWNIHLPIIDFNVYCIERRNIEFFIWKGKQIMWTYE